MNTPKANVNLPRFSASPNVGVAAANANAGSNSLMKNVGSTFSNAGKTVVSVGEGAGSFLMSWGAALLIVLVLVVLFAVYYKTIGYYIQLGWEKLGWSRAHGERIEIDIPGGPSAQLFPSPAPNAAPASSSGASIEDSLSGAIKSLESDVESALGGSGRKQVFNVSRNLYTFAEAEPLCRAFGAELATYDQVKDAYESGADWCNYGWVKGQLAIYPTQKSTYDKLQHGPESERMSCGLPGVNGGYFPNAEQRFGVNCYGTRPAESALDERVQMEERSNIAFDREVNHFKAELDSIAVNPWNKGQWSA
jgi:hypothetical protein